MRDEADFRVSGKLPPLLKGVLVLDDSDFHRLADSKRGERIVFVPTKIPAGARKGALVYVEGATRKTVLSEGRQYRLCAVVRGIATAPRTKSKSVVLVRTGLMLTDADLKRLPKPGSLIID